MQKILLLIYINLLLGMFAIKAQNDLPVQHNYNGLSFSAFAASIEQDYEWKCYFNPQWVDTLVIIQNKTHTNLSEILQGTLERTNLSFQIRDQKLILYQKVYQKDILIPGRWVTYVEKKKESGYATSTEAFLSDDQKTMANGRMKYRNLSIGDPDLMSKTGMASISGYITEAATGEPVIGAVVYNDELQKGTVSDVNGFFHIVLPQGKHLLVIRSLGYRDEFFQVNLFSDGQLNAEMESKVIKLSGVTIKADRYHNVAGLQVGLDKIDMNTIKKLPVALGEQDIIKSALLLPGVKSVGEGSSGFNVRGGSTDQNLILFNDAPIFNSSHFFGFYTAINPKLIQDFKLYKSGIPAEYGSRISSVMDIASKNGNKKEWTGSLGMGLVTTSGSLEGPVIKDKCSFILGARTTYSNWLLKRIDNYDIKNSKASFQDFNGKIHYELNTKNTIDLSGYYSYDYFKFNYFNTYRYENQSGTISWRHFINNNLYFDLKGIYSAYDYRVISQEEPTSSFMLKHQVDYREIKNHFTWFPSTLHKIKFGFNSIWYTILPGGKTPYQEESLVNPTRLESENANESAIFLDDELKISENLTMYFGLRYSGFFIMGPKTVYRYKEGIPLNRTTITDTIGVKSGELIKPVYQGPEFRFSLRYLINPQNSLKLSYNRMRQYIHMLSNTTAISPTDTWKLSDKHVSPQIGDQYTAGYYREFNPYKINASIEVYYKNIKDILEYKSDAKLLMNPTIEADLINAKGKAYGIELMIKKELGKLTGWFNYTYSRVLIKAASEFFEEEINGGVYYPANFDQPHEVNILTNYKISRRVNFSNTFTYFTGRPITYPVARYQVLDVNLLHYSNRNEYRVPDYIRWDFLVNIEGNLKSKKIGHNSWTFSIYNVTGRKNVYSIFFDAEKGEIKGHKLSVFARPIVSVSYAVNF